MNYYPHHIGDFNNATRHLTRVERALYRDLIEMYYDTEKPLPANDFPGLCRRVLAVSVEEREAVSAILAEFFTKEGEVYRHSRCEEELEAYRNKHEIAIRAGKASAQSRLNKRSTSVQRTLNKRATNQEPRTKNQRVEEQPRSQGSRLPPDWLPSETIKTWAVKERPDLQVELTIEKFRDYWTARPGKAGLKLDWEATFRNWVRDEKPGRRQPQAAAGEVI